MDAAPSLLPSNPTSTHPLNPSLILFPLLLLLEMVASASANVDAMLQPCSCWRQSCSVTGHSSHSSQSFRYLQAMSVLLQSCAKAPPPPPRPMPHPHASARSS